MLFVTKIQTTKRKRVVDMGRPKKISNEIIVNSSKEYFSVICHGDIKKMTYKNLAEYISSKININVADYDLKKCHELKEYITDIRNKNERTVLNSVIYFKRLDINNFLRMNDTESKLRNTLIQLDNSYEEVCMSATKIYEENRRIRERNNKLLVANRKLKSEISEQHSTKNTSIKTESTLKKEIKALKNRIRVLLDIINTNVYPEIANELLAEKGLIKMNNSIISNSGKTNIMNDNESIISFINKREEVLNKTDKDTSDINRLMHDLINNIEEKE